MNLPKIAQEACNTLQAPANLIRHLEMVHEAALAIKNGLQDTLPDLDWDQVLVGAAIHDLGKVFAPEELRNPGNKHEQIGQQELIKIGIPEKYAKHASLHGCNRPKAKDDLEACLVALADASWKGARYSDMETEICSEIAARTKKQVWEIYILVDDILRELGKKSEYRLEYQRG
jgi:HD superfamily phosphodiesterase